MSGVDAWGNEYLRQFRSKHRDKPFRKSILKSPRSLSVALRKRAALLSHQNVASATAKTKSSCFPTRAENVARPASSLAIRNGYAFVSSLSLAAR
jgi:hypothetical protein